MTAPSSFAVVFSGNTAEASLVKTRLESEGVESFVWGENASNAWGAGAILLVVRVAVARTDEDIARKILSNI
jgi:hypothetical protein